MVGYEIVSIPTNPKGVVEIADIKPLIDESVAGIMMTNPNTLGLFEDHIHEIAELIHAVDGVFYMDGANFNAILGIVRPGDLGVDVMHINLHKTFSTPHGGGGPGAGAVAVREHLREFLPNPRVVREGSSFRYDYHAPYSIGRIGGYFGNFAIHIRALTYMLSIGTTEDGESSYLRKIAEAAVLNANYIRVRLQDHYDIPFKRICMHECLISDRFQEEYGIKTLDIAKRLMDYGYHPMTVYFPLVVSGAMLIEPTESETKEALDEFCDAMIQIANEVKTDRELVAHAPTRTFRRRVDELRAQKQARLRWL
jgi:glycine dehydrogenase subunit 2